MFKYFNTLFIVFSIIINLMKCSKFCIYQEECIEKIKKLTGDVNLFWFGDEWRTLCDHRYFKYQQKSKSVSSFFNHFVVYNIAFTESNRLPKST